MNGERGIDLNTDFQRANLCVTITEEKTSLLRNNETKEFLFIEDPTIKEGYTNYHLHILFPERDKTTGKKNDSITGRWSIERFQSPKCIIDGFAGLYYKPVMFNPEIHSSFCRRILASTARLNNDPEWDKTTFIKTNDDVRIIYGYVCNICSSLVEIFAKMQGELSYVMVQPLYSLNEHIIKGKRVITVRYKKDIDNFIAVFPAVAYNKARLKNQLY